LGRAASRVLDVQLSALQQEGKAKLLAAPRLSTMNHERAWIESGSEIPFRSQSVSGGGVTTFTVDFKTASIELEVTPHVVGANSSASISLDVVVTRKEADFSRAIDGNPPLISRTIYTRALVREGETAVIGGLMREDISKSVDKVPFFSDLPYVGWLFQRTRDKDDKTQLMIFLTPSVLPTPLTTDS
jgi:type IV pilus assembly protein PilQ